MPTPFNVVKSTSTVGDTAMTAATETVVATLNGISTQTPDQLVTLIGSGSVLTQAGGTTVTLRIRRVSLAGALVGEGNPHNIGASLSSRLSEEFDDIPGDVAGLTYVLTATSAVGNATFTDAALMAILHS
jgi:hypothetical protein